MVLEIGALFAFVGRQVGKLVQLAFSWATLMLFGQVPKDKQVYLSIMAVLSLLWPVALAGVAIPSVATFLLGFVTVPDGLHGWVRLGMLALALLAPLGVGFVAIKLRDEQPRGLAFARTLLAGYPNALALAVVLVWLMVITPIVRIQAIIRRHDSAHVPIAIHPGAYERVVDDLRASLERAGLPVHHTFAPWPFEVPGRILGFAGGAGVRALVPQRLSQLHGREFFMTVHPMDLSLSGKTIALGRARSALVRELTFTQAYQTWTKEAHEIEDLLLECVVAQTPVATVGTQLDRANLPFEEWEILYRMLMQVRLRRSGAKGGDAVDGGDSEHPGL